MNLAVRPAAREGAGRCPYCLASVSGRVARCAACDAAAHAACALELARCGACGAAAVDPDGPVDGWELRALAGLAAWVRVTRDAPARLVDARGRPVTLLLRVDLLRRRVQPGGLLAGEVTLSLPGPLRLGALRLLALGPRRGLLRRREVRALHLLGPERPAPWLPGTYRVAFRAPAEALGQATRVSAVLARPRGALVGALDVRVEG